MDNRDTDTISRYAVIDALGDTRAFYFDSDKGMVQATKGQTGYEGWYKVHDVFQTIDNLPPSPSRPQWIPCSNRLPDEEVLCCDTRGEMIIGYPYQDEESNTGYSAVLDDIVMIDCTAWMSLPEPYHRP